MTLTSRGSYERCTPEIKFTYITEKIIVASCTVTLNVYPGIFLKK